MSIIFSNTVNYNLELINQVEIDNASNNYGVSDVWGYTDETGLEYAIIGYELGTHIYRITDSEAILISDIISSVILKL